MSARSTSPRRAPFLVGWREWAALPDLGVARVKAKIDTGARTSAIHAWGIETYTKDGAPWVRFELHPKQRDNAFRVACEAPVHDERMVRSSTGHAQRRVVIRTTLTLGAESWPIDLTLARRDEMGFRMLIGRMALKRRALVDPSRSYLCKAGSADGSAAPSGTRSGAPNIVGRKGPS